MLPDRRLWSEDIILTPVEMVIVSGLHASNGDGLAGLRDPPSGSFLLVVASLIFGYLGSSVSTLKFLTYST